MTTPDLAGLCERLREHERRYRRSALLASNRVHRDPNQRSQVGLFTRRADDLSQSAAAIESLVAENERMREALKPFADVLADIGQDEADADLYRPMSARFTTRDPIRIGALRRARTALEGASDDR